MSEPMELRRLSWLDLHVWNHFLVLGSQGSTVEFVVLANLFLRTALQVLSDCHPCTYTLTASPDSLPRRTRASFCPFLMWFPTFLVSEGCSSNMFVVVQSLFCDPMDCCPVRSSAHGILQARLLEWVAVPSSSGSFRPRDQRSPL